MKIIPLIENSRVENFHSERGLSLYIEAGGKKVIFDTGKSDKVIDNLRRLNIDVFQIDYFIISHGHRDHIGGLPHLLEMGIDPQKVIVERRALDTFSFNFIFKREIGLNPEELEKLGGIRRVDVDGVYKLEEGIYLVSPGGEEFPLYYRGDKPDDFTHEISLVVVEDGKLDVVVGCCHFGVERLMGFLQENFNGPSINSITGGLHTRSLPLNPIALIKFIAFLKRSRVKKYCLGHCTGRGTIFLAGRSIEGIERLTIGREYSSPGKDSGRFRG